MPDAARMHAVILGAERGIRRLDPTQSYPLALTEVGTPASTSGAADEARPGSVVDPAAALGTSQSVLEWTLAALDQAGVGERLFVGGYHIQKVVDRFPSLRFAFHAEWEKFGTLSALLRGLDRPLPDGDVLVLLGDVALRAEALAALSGVPNGTLAAGLVHPTADERGRWSARDGALTPGAAFTFGGVLRIPRGLLAAVRARSAALITRSPNAGIEDLLVALVHAQLPAQGVDVSGACASVRRPRDLAAFVLGTKGQTLQRLSPLINEAIIPPAHTFTVGRWRREPGAVLDEISGTMGAARLVVRSSSMLEDLFESSNAGRFHSELDVARADLPAAIDRVIASYARGHGRARSAAERDGDQVLVQHYVADAVCNGVLFTRVPDTGAPYAVLNFDRCAGRTDTITGGRSRSAQTMIRARGTEPPEGRAWTDRVFRLGRRLEELLRHDGLDVEFAVDAQDRIYLLQVRPISTVTRERAYGDEDVRFELDEVARTVRELTGPSPTLLGARGALGVMPDWNPAEIIGVCPRALAMSLYRRVVTDRVWADARRDLGYRRVEFTPLLWALGGRPYIDVRASLNSLLPATLDDAAGAALIDSAIDHLRSCPHLHDKIEFELLPTCGDADPERWRERLSARGLSADVVQRVLVACAAHTSSLLERGEERLRGLMEQCGRMSAAREHAQRLCGPSPSGPTHLRAARLLLESASADGTRPFAALARCAFIALSLLRSFERVGVLTHGELEAVLGGLPSVAGDVARDAAAERAGLLPRATFLARHGHLRPGTYDILSPSYAESPEQYLGAGGTTRDASPVLAITAGRGRAILEARGVQIERALRAAGLACEAAKVIDFICAAIPAREQAKHEFTRNISLALTHLARGGEAFGLTRDDLSHLSADRLLHLAVETPSAAERTDLQRTIALARKRHQLSLALRLPHLLLDAGEVTAFTVSALRPNFVTRASTRGPGKFLRVGADTPTGTNLSGAVVLIENADPGYDWVFAHGIAGLVTKYGGVASHMAIRAAEFAIPAAIGCGDTIFDPLIDAPTIELDCGAERVRGAA